MDLNYPYIFLDDDISSLTHGMWCVRVDAGSSIDGFSSRSEAENFLTKLILSNIN